MQKNKGQFVKGMTPWNKGKPFSKEIRLKMSKAKLGKRKEETNRWKNGKTNHLGYVRIKDYNHPFSHNDYVFEHRLVIEKHLGRYLKPKEKCHHLGAKDDNRLHKLMAFSSNSAHQRFHHNPDNVKPNEIVFDGRKKGGLDNGNLRKTEQAGRL